MKHVGVINVRIYIFVGISGNVIIIKMPRKIDSTELKLSESNFVSPSPKSRKKISRPKTTPKKEDSVLEGRANIADDIEREKKLDEEQDFALKNSDSSNNENVSANLSLETLIPARVQKTYQIIWKCTGSIGGNGYDGAIYGELTMHSMQKVKYVEVVKILFLSN